MIMAWHRSNQTSKRLHYIPGVGPMLATVWSPVLLTPGPSGQDVTSRPGLGSFRSSTQARIHGTKHRPWLTALTRPAAGVGKGPFLRYRKNWKTLATNGQFSRSNPDSTFGPSEGRYSSGGCGGFRGRGSRLHHGNRAATHAAVKLGFLRGSVGRFFRIRFRSACISGPLSQLLGPDFKSDHHAQQLGDRD
jgi:hypothetical protein